VASGANILAKKVLDETGTGSSATTLRAISDVIEQHNTRKFEPGFKGSVINMSFNLAKSPAMNSAIQTAMGNGIHAVVAAGNEGTNSCNFSPSSVGGSGGNAISVGAISIQNQLSTFSNTGPCVDVYAPGQDIVSAWIGGDNVINAIDGTSMAAPHVTGLVAYHIARNSSLAQDPAAMKAFVRDSGLKSKISGSFYQGDPVILVNNGFKG
jgi:cerevisin